MGKLHEFSIILDSAQPVYYPGQVISGRVTVGLGQEMEMRSITVKLSGKGYCRWSEQHTIRDGENERTETEHYTGKETLIKEVRVLAGSMSGKFQHPPGRQEYPFSFTLVGNLPSSFEGSRTHSHSHSDTTGHIRYLLKANIDKPWKFDHKVKRPITVNDIIDPNKPQYASGTGGEKHKEVGCMCFKAGPLNLSASIDRVCFCPGEAILINALVQNQTNRDMTSMHAKLYQTVTYRASNNSKTNTREVAKLSGPWIPKGEEASWTNQPFGIPALPPTITNSNVITLHYKLKFIVGVPWGLDPTIKMYITMGTVPFIQSYGQNFQYGTPQDQQKPPQANFIGGPACPPPPPNVFGYPDMTPPSYSAVVGDTGVNIGKEKDQYTHGDLNYNPVYTFAQPYQGNYQGPSATPVQHQVQPYEGNCQGPNAAQVNQQAQPYQGNYQGPSAAPVQHQAQPYQVQVNYQGQSAAPVHPQVHNPVTQVMPH